MGDIHTISEFHDNLGSTLERKFMSIIYVVNVFV